MYIVSLDELKEEGLLPKSSNLGGSDVFGKKSGNKILDKVTKKVKFFLYALSLKKIIKFVIVLGVVLTGFLVVDFFYQKSLLTERFVKVNEAKRNTDKWKQKTPSFIIASKEFLRKGTKGNIFAFVPSSTLKAVMNKELEWIKEAEKRIAQLTFVGVWYDEGQVQVLIEDNIGNESYAFKQGESFESFTVEDITEDSVVLKKKDKEWVLD